MTKQNSASVPTMSETSLRLQIRAEIAAIAPLDALERQHISAALEWVDSGVGLFRLAKPATPPIHLVSYFVVMDQDHVLLVDHKNAQRWLPPGGHVEPDEHPRDTVLREIQEELGFAPAGEIGPPVMLTSTVTVGLSSGHTDVSLWYVVEASRHQPLQFDAGEFNEVRWFQVSQVPVNRVEPHLGRFLAKLESKRESGSR